MKFIYRLIGNILDFLGFKKKKEVEVTPVVEEPADVQEIQIDNEVETTTTQEEIDEKSYAFIAEGGSNWREDGTFDTKKMFFSKKKMEDVRSIMTMVSPEDIGFPKDIPYVVATDEELELNKINVPTGVLVIDKDGNPTIKPDLQLAGSRGSFVGGTPNLTVNVDEYLHRLPFDNNGGNETE